MNWNHCIICGGSGLLKCPADSKANNGIDVYKHFIECVGQFQAINALPMHPIFLKASADKSPEYILENRGKWHAHCRMQFTHSKFIKTEQAQKKKRKINDQVDEEFKKVKRQNVGNSDIDPDICIFCGVGLSKEKLINCSTLNCNHNLRTQAIELQDTSLLSRIATRDVIANESKYHFSCLTEFRNRHKSFKRAGNKEENIDFKHVIESRVFAEIVSFIESETEQGRFVLKLSTLHGIYHRRLHELGLEIETNKTRLKLRLMQHFHDDCQKQFDGKHTLLVFNEGMKDMLKTAMNSPDSKLEALEMVKLAKIIRRDMFSWESFKFSGTFPPNFQSNSVPPSLTALIAILLNGPNAQYQDAQESQACLTIAQLILFNSKNKPTTKAMSRHTKNKEPPLPVYLGLYIHTITRSRKIIDNLFKHGIAINYDRVMTLEKQLSTAICKRFEEENIVCPPNLRKGIFTVGAIDNIDNNPSSTTSKGSLHGTGMSIFQFPTQETPGISRIPITLEDECTDIAICLPESYTDVPHTEHKTITNMCQRWPYVMAMNV